MTPNAHLPGSKDRLYRLENEGSFSGEKSTTGLAKMISCFVYLYTNGIRYGFAPSEKNVARDGRSMSRHFKRIRLRAGVGRATKRPMPRSSGHANCVVTAAAAGLPCIPWTHTVTPRPSHISQAGRLRRSRGPPEMCEPRLAGRLSNLRTCCRHPRPQTSLNPAFLLASWEEMIGIVEQDITGSCLLG